MTPRHVIIAIHPDDSSSKAVVKFIRTNFPWFTGIELKHDSDAKRPTAIGGIPKLAALDLQQLDSALAGEFPNRC